MFNKGDKHSFQRRHCKKKSPTLPFPWCPTSCPGPLRVQLPGAGADLGGGKKRGGALPRASAVLEFPRELLSCSSFVPPVWPWPLLRALCWLDGVGIVVDGWVGIVVDGEMDIMVDGGMNTWWLEG